MAEVPTAAMMFATELEGLEWVRDLMVAGSLATGDYVPEVSDLDLVAIVAGPMTQGRTAQLVSIHERLDRDVARGARLGCEYVDESRLSDPTARHPTWTHGHLIQRALSVVTRAELVRRGYSLFGRAPIEVFPRMCNAQIQAAALDELRG